MNDRLSLNEDGSLDEIVAHGVDLHIEQLDDTEWWLAFSRPDGTLVHVTFSTKRASIKAGWQSEGEKKWP